MKTIFLLIILGSSIVYSQNFKEVKVYLAAKKDIRLLASAGIPVEESFFDRKDKSLKMFVSDKDLKKIAQLGLRTETLIENWQDYFNKRQSNADEIENQKVLSKTWDNVKGFGFGSMGGFYTVNEVYNKLDSMKMLYPSLITSRFQIGTTVDGRPMYAIKISDSPDADENEPEVLYTALIHAREPESMMTLMYFMYFLLENYNTDQQVTYLLNNRELYFVPVINVDGYELNRSIAPQGGGMYRKNKNEVDLNRNFGYKWAYDDEGSSPNQIDETYRGPSAFSEPETKAIREFCKTHHFRNALNYHTYSNILISPWGYENKESPDSLIFRDFSADMTKYNNYGWGTSGDLLYNTNGDSDDWMYGEQSLKNKIYSMTPEVGGDNDGFWPAKNRILPIAKENLYPNLYIAWAAGSYVRLAGFQQSKEYVNPGESFDIKPVFRNKGLEDAENFTAELIPLNDKSSVDNGSLSFGMLKSRSTVTSESSFTVNISPQASLQDEISMLMKVKTGDLEMSSDTLSIKLGTPKIIFADTSKVISANWYSSGGWDTTSADYHSAPSCYTDSRTGLYRNGVNASLIMKNSVDLKGYDNPALTFYTKYDIEKGWDYGQVKISTDNGLNWTALKGNYTRTGSSSQIQEPLYDGKQDSWVKETIDLSAYTGSKIKIRFDLTTDGYLQKDGWYIDDISIVYFSALPVELAAFNLAVVKNAVKISWSTVTEINNSGFTVQRSADKIKWSDLEFVKGNGSTVSVSRYVYYDNSPLNGKSYYRLIQADYNGTKKIYDPGEVDASGIFDYALFQNYPNPFNPETVIAYSLAEPGFVSLIVYDITGRRAAVLVNDYQEAGRYESVLNTDNLNLSSGTYIYTLRVNGLRMQKKMLFVK